MRKAKRSEHALLLQIDREATDRPVPGLTLGEYIDRGAVYVIEDEGVVGFVVAPKTSFGTKIKHVAVRPRFQRRGWGSELIAGLVKLVGPPCYALIPEKLAYEVMGPLLKRLGFIAHTPINKGRVRFTYEPNTP